MTFIEQFPRFRADQVRYMLPVFFVAVSGIAFFYSEHVLRSPFVVSFMGAVAVSALFGIIPGLIASVLATLVL